MAHFPCPPLYSIRRFSNDAISLITRIFQISQVSGPTQWVDILLGLQTETTQLNRDISHFIYSQEFHAFLETWSSNSQPQYRHKSAFHHSVCQFPEAVIMYLACISIQCVIYWYLSRILCTRECKNWLDYHQHASSAHELWQRIIEIQKDLRIDRSVMIPFRALLSIMSDYLPESDSLQSWVREQRDDLVDKAQ